MAHGNTLLSVRAAEGTVPERITQRLRGLLGSEHSARYLAEGLGAAVSGSDVRIPVASAFVARLLERRFHDLVRRLVADEIGCAEATVRFVVPEAVGASAGPAAVSRPAAVRPVPAVRHVPGLRGRAGAARGFESLVQSPANAMAIDAARRLAIDPASGSAVLFAAGPCGVGKTHLLTVVADAYAEAFPGRHVKSITGEAFVNAFVSACVNKRFERFRAAFRSVDLLVIDDLQAVAGKPGTQAELVSTLDALAARGARVAVSAHVDPRRLAGLSAALMSRLCAGLVVSMAAPEPAQHAQLAAALAGRRGLTLDVEAAATLARACGELASVREMEGLVLRVDAVHRLMAGQGAGAVSAGSVRAALGEADGRDGWQGWSSAGAAGGSPGAAPRPIRAEAILACVCNLTGVSEDEVRGRTRGEPVVLARSLAALLCRELTAMSYPEIARALGRPNHSSVITAIQRVSRQLPEAARVMLGSGRGAATAAEIADRARSRLGAGRVAAGSAA